MAKKDKSYSQWISHLKEKIRSSQIKAAGRVMPTWCNCKELGKEIVEKKKRRYGVKFPVVVGERSKAEFPNVVVFL